MKDLNSFNLSLLGKWVDRILNNEEGLWVKVIKSKYRENPFLEGSGERLLRGRVRGGGVMSGWWFEICKIYWGIKGEGMRKDFVRIVGKGNNTRFWADWWVGDMLLNEKFQRLFRISGQQFANICEMGKWEGGEWRWELEWRRELRVRDLESLNSLLGLLNNCRLNENEDDKWRWTYSSNGAYSTSEAYKQIRNAELQETNFLEKKAFKDFRKNYAPQRIKAIVWKAMKDRLPTRVELHKRVIPLANSNLDCPLCAEHEETIGHILFSCKVSWSLWVLVYKWIGLEVVCHNTPVHHYLQHAELFGGKKGKMIAATVWSAIIWVIWNARNEYVFNGKEFVIQKAFREIKARVWSWIVIRDNNFSQVSFKDWNSNRRKCC